MKKICSLILCFMLILGCIPAQDANAAVDYNKYSNRKVYWYVKRNKSHAMPGGASTAASLKKYDTFYAGVPVNGERVVYLTFDCGYEYGITSKFLDILKKYKIKAAFFVTTEFINESPNVVKRMKKEGHIVGNHSTKHLSIPNMSISAMTADLKKCKDTMKKKTGYTMDPFFRPPMGEYSARKLKLAKDLGYTSILWSHDVANDWDTSRQPSVNTVLNSYKIYRHKGMLPLIHCVSKSNLKALPAIIEHFKAKGYRFGSLYELPGKNQNLKKANMK